MTKDSKGTYDDDPVYYCKRCLSLSIKDVPFVKDKCYCTECTNADIGVTSIEEWKEMYRKKYGHDYIEKRELKWPYWC